MASTVFGDRDRIPRTIAVVSAVMYQIRDTVFYWDIQTPRKELKIQRAEEYF